LLRLTSQLASIPLIENDFLKRLSLSSQLYNKSRIEVTNKITQGDFFEFFSCFAQFYMELTINHNETCAVGLVTGFGKQRPESLPRTPTLLWHVKKPLAPTVFRNPDTEPTLILTFVFPSALTINLFVCNVCL